ncbi:MAG: 5-formyltetrahydrofolate cyclo-ligase [Nitrospirae bacterium]|nr:5-formyltetrahydrofolate cyclo-ligase [Nitrospirota bacterium]
MKEALRQQALSKRNIINTADREIKNDLIRKHLFNMSEFEKARTVFFYASFGTEVETLTAIEASLRSGKRVALPVVDRDRNGLRVYEIKAMADLGPGFMGIPEPKVLEGRAIELKDIDLMIIPGVGFDIAGNRLGYGVGYYDRLLGELIDPSIRMRRKKSVPIIALCFEEQILSEIPPEAHDIRVNKIITEKRVIDCHG